MLRCALSFLQREGALDHFGNSYRGQHVVMPFALSSALFNMAGPRYTTTAAGVDTEHGSGNDGRHFVWRRPRIHCY